MAKRFTDTNKYKKPFIRGLQGAYKLLWDYLYHDCDHCGIWIVNFDIAQLYIGSDMPVEKEKALALFNRGEQRIIEISDGEKWFIPSFIEFQYGHLSEKNRAHITVISTLNKFGFLNKDLSIKNNQKGLVSPLQGDKDKAQEQEQLKDKEKDRAEINGSLNGFVIYDAEAEVLKNQIELDRICSVTGNSLESGKLSLRKYHLHLEEHEQYPKGKKAIFAGFEKWLINEKKFSNNGRVKENRVVGKDDPTDKL